MSGENKQTQGKKTIYRTLILLASVLLGLLIPILLPVIAAAMIIVGFRLYRGAEDKSTRAYAIAVLVSGLALGLLSAAIFLNLGLHYGDSAMVTDGPEML